METTPYQPFRSPYGGSCMAGYLCPMPLASSLRTILSDAAGINDLRWNQSKCIANKEGTITLITISQKAKWHR